MAGYIKLHRQLLDSLQFSDPNYLKVWIWILLKANHKPGRVFMKISRGVTEIKVERGQFVFGRHKASDELSMSDSKIYRIIKKFEIEGAITLKSNNHYTLLSVCKYDDYNKNEDNFEQPSEQPTEQPSEQPTDTNKNDKKGKNVKKVFIAPSSQEVFDYFVSEGHLGEVGAKAHEYYSMADWKDKNGNKVVNWKQKMKMVWMKPENKIKTIEQERPMVY